MIAAQVDISGLVDWLIKAGALAAALGAMWHFWGAPVKEWIKERVDGAEARLVGIERQLVISNGSIKTTETRVNEVVEALAAHQEAINPLLASIEVRVTETAASLEERRLSIDPLIAGIGERVVATDIVLRAHIVEALPMIRAYNAEHPEAPIPTTPVIGPPLGSPSLPSEQKE